jgi:hypothetical protein
VHWPDEKLSQSEPDGEGERQTDVLPAPADGAIGCHASAVVASGKHFRVLARSIVPGYGIEVKKSRLKTRHGLRLH